jgi:hypothetical protein
MGNQSNIEDFLKNKFAEQDNTPATDWHVFEEKLNRAMWFSRVRSAAAVGLFALALFAGFNSIQKMGAETADSAWQAPVSFALEGIDELDVEDLGEVVIVNHEEKSSSQDIIETVKHETPSTLNLVIKEEETKTNSALPSTSTLSVPESNQSIARASDEEVNAIKEDQNQENMGSTLLALPQGEEESDLESEAVEEIDYLRDAPEFVESLKPKRIKSLIAQQRSARLATMSSDVTTSHRDLSNLNYASNEARKFGTPRSIISPLPARPRKSRAPYISPLQAKNPWSYSINVYPNFTFRKFRVDRKKANFLHRDFVDAIEASESGGFSLNVGLEVSRRIGPITYLNGGVEYISYNTDASFSFTNFRDANINSSTGEIESYRIKERPIDIAFADENSYHYMNFPLSISYQPWATSHIRLNLEAGGSFMYFLGAQGKTIDFTTLEIMELSERTYRKYLGSFSVKVGANYFISERINFGFEPTLMYFTNTIYTAEMPFYVIPYSVGLNVHMQVKLN